MTICRAIRLQHALAPILVASWRNQLAIATRIDGDVLALRDAVKSLPAGDVRDLLIEATTRLTDVASALRLNVEGGWAAAICAVDA